jgi:hypothetical protein
LHQFGGKDLDPETCQLWFASRALAADRPLSDALGRNERTRAVVKATKKGAGAPAREPVSTAPCSGGELLILHPAGFAGGPYLRRNSPRRFQYAQTRGRLRWHGSTC